MQTAALYIRVSTDKQEELSPDAQLRLLKEYAQKNDMLIKNDLIFMENGISGKKADKRPQFQKMIGMAKTKEHPFDVILVWKFSRFARNQEESIVYKSLLKKNNVDVVSISEPIIDGPFGSLIERIIEWMDEYYSIRLSGEVIRGMTENAMRGKRQAKSPFGYILDGEDLIIDKQNEEYVKRIFNNYVYKSMSFYGIANELNNDGIVTKNGNLFNTRSIKYILDNPIYMGYVMWGIPYENRHKRNKIESEGAIIRKGIHEPIIPEELFYLAQKRLKREYKYKAMPSESQIHWLSTMLHCSSCGRTLVSAGGKVPSFQCSGYKKHQCKESHYVRVRNIEKVVIKSLYAATKKSNLKYTNLAVMEKSDEIKSLNNRLDKCMKKEERIKTAYRDGVDTLDEYKQNKLIINKEKEIIEQQITAIKNNFSKSDDNEMHKRITNAYAIISSNNATSDEKRMALKSVVSDITYDKKTENIEVSYFLT